LNNKLKQKQLYEHKRIYIESLPEFSNAVQMYEKLGFKKLDKALGSSGHTTCTIWMIRDV